jgi:hypothetical protein
MLVPLIRLDSTTSAARDARHAIGQFSSHMMRLRRRRDNVVGRKRNGTPFTECGPTTVQEQACSARHTVRARSSLAFSAAEVVRM